LKNSRIKKRESKKRIRYHGGIAHNWKAIVVSVSVIASGKMVAAVAAAVDVMLINS
jgi:hypothetical protein